MIAMPRFARILAVLAALAASAGAALAAGPKAYVGNFKDSTVSVIDTASERVVATLPVAAGPDGIVLTPDGRTVFVSGSSAAAVSEIDAASDRVTRSVDVGKGPQGLAMTADGKWLLVAVNGDDRVAFVDTSAHGVSATVPVPKPHTIAIRPDGRQAYVASQEPGHFALVVIDMATRAVVTQIPLDKPPRDLEFGHDGKALYLTLAGVPAVQVLDPATNQWGAPVPTGVSPHIAQHFAGMANGAVVVQGPGEVMLFDPVTRAAVRSIGVGKQPHWLDLSADGKKLWVSNEGSNDVSVVDLGGGAMHTVAVGNAPRKIAVQRVALSEGAHAGASTHVTIRNFAFEPAQIIVKAGERVSWQNDDGAPHGLVFKDGSAGIDLLLPGKSFARSFDKPGVYEYACSVHPYMTARVTVVAPARAAAPTTPAQRSPSAS
ncbi:plastocyanin/azurin family copper-binding protein [Variovorax sp. NFACC27]|uniref:YVTN family beta-propeller repeat protein n=1 Tax=unclassified Variovorax TaxID=663243 RepID=UPI0008975AC7|nr:40-residue YVTN family beta-propeller repeat-containing protein [Variovorax sp. NFACC28]SEG60691.1 40-residue YVTN family beta-propeller repeat-containing protein [Variovorax sp. NFACC29]SFC60310.1 40-residue YVTN family beta-propeller repeat-containing protein [Variovorax sp. NFACC26]SFG67562.1 40-residue YVTN family beta-propeller repeat-containing protein [Variovorax sp. NFACC27]